MCSKYGYFLNILKIKSNLILWSFELPLAKDISIFLPKTINISSVLVREINNLGIKLITAKNHLRNHSNMSFAFYFR